jgi:hypothetical protein
VGRGRKTKNKKRRRRGRRRRRIEKDVMRRDERRYLGRRRGGRSRSERQMMNGILIESFEVIGFMVSFSRWNVHLSSESNNSSLMKEEKMRSE